MRKEPVTCYRCSGSGEIQCPRCHGSGTCRLCSGRGSIYYEGTSTLCDCHGSGKCVDCHGAGKVSCLTCEGRGLRFFD